MCSSIAKALSGVLITSFLVFSLSACSPSGSEGSENNVPDKKLAEEKKLATNERVEEVSEAKVVAKLCFQNTYGTGEATDTQVLWFTRNNNEVEGEYHWLPAFKDKRMGSFKGKLLEAGVAEVSYEFMQEGIKDSQRIQLEFDDTHIEITGADESLGINADIARVECEEVPGS